MRLLRKAVLRKAVALAITTTAILSSTVTASATGTDKSATGKINVNTIEYISPKRYQLNNKLEDIAVHKFKSNKLSNFTNYSKQQYRIEKAYKEKTNGIHNSERFLTLEDGTVKLYKDDGSGDFVSTSWFMDTDGRWYAFNKDGVMLSGLIKDASRSNTVYVLSPMESEKGALQHTNGLYIVNGKLAYLTFNNLHNGTFGNITSNIAVFK